MSEPIIKGFIRTHLGSFVYLFSMAAFGLQLHRVEKLSQRVYGLQSLRYLLSEHLQKKVCWPLFNNIDTLWHNLGFLIFSMKFCNSLNFFFFFPERTLKQSWLWKKFDSLGWFEMTPLDYGPVLSGSCLKGPAFTHLLDTLELSLDGKAVSLPNQSFGYSYWLRYGFSFTTLWVHSDFLNHL